MKPALKYFGHVEDGKIVLNRSQALAKEVANVYEGDAIEVTFKKHRGSRSNPQNKYYWGAVIPALVEAFKDMGHGLQVGNPEHHEMIHGLMKDKFLFNGIELTDSHGELLKTPPSTRTLDKGEFSEYIDNIRDWAADAMGIYIPGPNEQAELTL